MNSSILTPRRIIIAVAIIAAVLLLRECFKNRNTGGGAPDQVTIRYDAAANNLNPYLTALGSNIYTCARIFQTFCDINPKTLELQPAIIKSIPQMRTVQDGPHAGELAYDFEIIPEAVWDNGTPITGNDVAFALKIIFQPLIPSSKAFVGYFNDLSGLDIDPANPKKFTIYFRKFYFMALESMCQIPLLPAYHYDPSNHLTNTPIADFLDSTKLSAMTTAPGMIAFAEEFQQPKFTSDPTGITGSGPYKLESMNDQGVILVKKENWWGDKVMDKYPILAAYPKRLVYKVVKDETVVENMVKNGELDIVSSTFSPFRFLEMKQNDSLAARYNFEMLPAMSYSRWIFNLSKPNLQDIRIRKALAHIVDYDHFIKNVRSGYAVRTVGPILPSKPYYAKDIVMYDFNIQKAKDLLKDAGWTDSDGDGYVDKTVDGRKTRLVIEVLVPVNRANQLYAESATETARLAGIEIKAVSTDLPVLGARTKSGDFESAFLGAQLFPGLTELSQRYHSKRVAPNGDNRSRYINPKLDSLTGLIASEHDETKRGMYYLEAQKILHEDLPEVFLMAPDQPIITSKKFEGVVTANRPGYYEQMFKLKSAN